jgi:hypothetical protein
MYHRNGDDISTTSVSSQKDKATLFSPPADYKKMCNSETWGPSIQVLGKSTRRNSGDRYLRKSEVVKK